MAGPRLLTKLANVLKCGALLPEMAMNSTSLLQAASIPRELMIPREYASSTIFKSTRGS
jgi:hypothetical protein